jgi:allergen V5/tpx-1 related protein
LPVFVPLGPVRFWLVIRIRSGRPGAVRPGPVFAPLGAVPSGPIIRVRAARSDGSLEAEGASQVGPKAGAKHRA